MLECKVYCSGVKQFLSLILVALWFASGSPAGADQNRALYLDGDGDFVDLPRGALSALDQATIEAWVRWEEYGLYSQWFTYGEEWLGMGINHNIADPTFKFFNYVDYRPKVAQVTTDLPRSLVPHGRRVGTRRHETLPQWDVGS